MAGQVVEVDARRVHALRARKRDWTGALGPDGIDENAIASRLDQETSRARRGRAQPLAIEARAVGPLKRGWESCAPSFAAVTSCT